MKRTIKGLMLAALLGCISTLAHAAQPCRITDARYEMIGNRDVSAGFKLIKLPDGWASDLALFIKTPRGQTYWFLFDVGTARYINLISTTNVEEASWTPPSADGGQRPLSEMHFLAANKALLVAPSIPKSHDQAPDYILLPDLSEVLAYRAEPRENIPTGFFSVTRCQTRR